MGKFFFALNIFFHLCCEDPAIIRCPGATTTLLWKHLEKHHVDEFTELKKKSGPLHGVKKIVGKLMRQPTINDVMTTKAPYGKDHPKQKKFDEN